MLDNDSQPPPTGDATSIGRQKLAALPGAETGRVRLALVPPPPVAWLAPGRAGWSTSTTRRTCRSFEPGEYLRTGRKGAVLAAKGTVLAAEGGGNTQNKGAVLAAEGGGNTQNKGAVLAAKAVGTHKAKALS